LKATNGADAATMPSMVRFCIAGSASPSGKRHRQDPDLLERLDLDRRAALGTDLLPLEVGDRADRLVREQHQRAVDAGVRISTPLSAPNVASRRGSPDRSASVAVQHVVEQAGRIEHLEARLEADPEAVGRAADLDRAERHAFHHGGKLAELVRRIDLDLDAPPDALPTPALSVL
jgi:hypothetical protein